MGAPSSPVLSNLITIPLDQKLLELSTLHRWTFTRYADDMSFSSKRPITEAQIDAIEYAVQSQELSLNKGKKRLFGHQDSGKSVTGLLVGGKAIELPPEYLDELEVAIQFFSKAIDVKNVTRNGIVNPHDWTAEIQQAVRGKIEFARQILGENHPTVRRLRADYLDAVTPTEEYESLSWLDFGYENLLHRNW